MSDTTLSSDKSLTSTQTTPLESSTTIQTSDPSLESKKQTSSSLPTIGVSSLPPELASAPIIPVGFTSEQTPISQDSVVKNTLSGPLDSKSSNPVSQDSVGKNTLSGTLDSKSSSSIPTTSSTLNSLESTPKSFVESIPTELNQSALTTSPSTSKELSPTSNLLPTQSRVKSNQTSAVLVPTSNKTQESIIVPAKPNNQESSIIPEAVKQQSNITAIRTNVNNTTTSFPKHSSKDDGNSSLHSGGTALIILTILFIGIISGLLFWRRRRRDSNERKNTLAGMEKVNLNKKGRNSKDLEKGEYLNSSDNSMTESDRDFKEEGGYFGKRGIVRSSRPRSLLLKKVQVGEKNTFAINQTPSIQSQQVTPKTNHDGLQVPVVRSNRLQNRPNSWRSSIAVAWASLGIPARLLNEPSQKHSPGINSLDRSNSSSTNGSHKKPFESQTYRPPLPHYLSTQFKGPAADHENQPNRLSQIIREEDESSSCVSVSDVEDGSSSLQSESPTNGSSITGSYTSSSIESSKLSRSSSSRSTSSESNQRTHKSLNSGTILEGSFSSKNSRSDSSLSDNPSQFDETNTISSKANSFFTEEIGLHQISSNSKIGSEVSLSQTDYNHHQHHHQKIEINQKPIEMIVHGNAM